MDSLELAVIIGLCLKMALTAVALTIVVKMRAPSSKGTRKLKRADGQREESAREEKSESRPVLKSSSGHDIHKRAVSSGEKLLKPGIAVNGVRKQVQPKNTAPVESSEPRVDLKARPVSHTAPPGAPRGQSAITKPKSGETPPREPLANNTSGGERKRTNGITSSAHNKVGEQIGPTGIRKQVQPKNTAPVESSKPKVTSKDDSVKHTAFLGAPQPQAAFTVSGSGGKPPNESPAGNTSGGEKKELLGNVEPSETIIKKDETSMDTKPGTEGNQASSEPPAATTDSGETDKEMPQKQQSGQQSGLGDLADLFATSASEFTEKNKLADQVNDVDVNELLQEGLGLLGKVKKSDG